MCPERWRRIVGSAALVMATAPKKLVSKLAAEFKEPDIFGESGDRESSVVHKNIEATVIADDGVNEGGQGIEVSNIECADIDLGGETCGSEQLDRDARGGPGRASWRQRGIRLLPVRWK